MADGILKRIGSGFDRYIGGLLGEDLSGLSKEEKAQARRQAIGIISRGMLSPDQGSAALTNVMAARKAKRDAPEIARRQADAEAMLPRISGRLFGGMPTATMPEGGEGELTGVNVQSRYRQDPADAMRLLTATQAGRDVAAGMPDLAKLAQEGLTGRVVGGSIQNPLTGAFSKPPEEKKYMLNPTEVKALGLPRGTIVERGADGGLKIVREPPRATGASTSFLTLTPQEIEAAGLPKGTVAQRNAATRELKILSAIPQAERTAASNRARSLKRVEAGVENLQEQLEKITTGGFMGFSGALSRITDSQDAREFETYREQLSNALRTALRIPGEGALSDKEQAQYGLTLPSLSLSKDRNISIMRAIEDQVRINAEMPMIEEESPEELDPMVWRMMTPSERAAYKRAGGK